MNHKEARKRADETNPLKQICDVCGGCKWEQDIHFIPDEGNWVRLVCKNSVILFDEQFGEYEETCGHSEHVSEWRFE